MSLAGALDRAVEALVYLFHGSRRVVCGYRLEPLDDPGVGVALLDAVVQPFHFPAVGSPVKRDSQPCNCST